MTLYLNGTTGISGVDGSAGTPALQGTDANTGISFPAADTIAFNEGGVEAARIDSSARLLVGTSSASSGSIGQYAYLQVKNSTFGASAAAAITLLGGGNSSSISSGSILSRLVFSDNQGGEYGLIECMGDGAGNTNDYPGRLVFSTTADGASSPTERMRIRSDGDIAIAKTALDDSVAGVYIQASGTIRCSRSDSLAVFNRLVNDGTLIEFLQGGATEGSVSVSGTTVSYNGAHLSRWSQLPGGAVREEILRGTVLSNIDEMCGWGEEDNEQLNRMKVSDVEGDPNVAGVFQGWDDDDDTYTDDFYCAMTGDFIIRIAAGVPVHRGQLLISAGDGTAIPQDDDIIRSKTIAKVTSNHVTCTYDDGSYCVPCVLMAC